MQNHEDFIDTINDLVRINYDRVYGYQTAIEDVDKEDVDLKAIFNQYVNMSHDFISHWQHIIQANGGDPATDSTIRGKVYRVWMDFKATLTGGDRKSVIDSCVFGEKAALEAYEEALATDAHLPDDIRQEIAKQKSQIASSLQNIEAYSTMHQKVS